MTVKKKRKKPRTSGITVSAVSRKRQANPDALAALLKLFDDKGRPENAVGFVRAYELLFHHGPLAGYDLNDLAQGKDWMRWEAIHQFLNPMRKYGLVEYVGRRRADTGGSRKLYDVTNKIPALLPTYAKHFSENGKASWKRNGNKHRGTASVKLSDAAWLKISAEAISRLLDVQDKLGKYFPPECRRAVTFLKDEAARCEQNKGT